MARLASLLVCCSLASACTSAEKPTEEAVEAPKIEETQEPESEPPSAIVSSIGLPASSYALITVPDPAKRLAELRVLANILIPSDPVTMDVLAKQVEVFDAAHPIYVLVLDPQTYDSPVALVGRISDADGLLPMFPSGTEKRTSGKYTILATPDTAKSVDPWVAESLQNRASPAVITAEFDTAFMRQRYAMLRPLLMMGMEQDGPGGALGLRMFELLESTGEQVGGLQVRLELGSDRFDLVLLLEGKPDTTFRALARAQASARVPADLVRKIASEDAHAVGAANLTEQSRAAMETMMNEVFAGPNDLFPEHFAGLLKRWNEVTGDEMAFSGRLQGIARMSVGYYIEVDDAEKAQAFLENDWSEYFSKSFESLGFSKFEGLGCTTDSALLGDGVDVLRCKGHTTFLEQPGGIKLPDQDTETMGAVVDGFMLMSLGDPDQFVALNERLHAEPTSELPWLAEVERRQEWGVMHLDTAKVAQSLGAPGTPGTTTDFALGSEGNTISVRLGIPAEAVRAMMLLGQQGNSND